MSGFNAVYNNVNFALQLHAKTMYGLQEQASSGSRINRPSDDASAAYRVMGLDSEQRYLANFVKNIENAGSSLEMAIFVLAKMGDALTDTKTDLTQIISGTYGEGENAQIARNNVALQINDILEQMVSFANTKHVDQFIFAGHSTSAAPYVVQREDGEIVSVAYRGGAEGRSINVAPDVQSQITYVGEDIFSLDNRQTPVFYGMTGAAVGTGTPSVKGDFWLTVTHDGSNYKLSIDGGTTEVTVPAVGDVSNIAVSNSEGQVLYVDATDLSATGIEHVRVPGTHDLFNTLISLRDLLRNEQGLPIQTVAHLIDEAAETLNDLEKGMVGKESSIGMKINFLESLKDNLESIKFNSDEEATSLEQADIAQIAIDIARRETLYEMSLAVAGKLMSMTLLDFIR